MTGYELVQDYLRRLHDASNGLPRAQRAELRDEIGQHLRDALAEDDSESAIRDVLDRLGEPEEITAELRPPPQPGIGGQQWWAIILLFAGGFLAGIGWLVGVMLLWTSRAWTVREKLVGTLLVPGGLATVFLFVLLPLGGTELCTSGSVTSGGVTRSVTHCTGATSTAERVLALILLALLLIGPFVGAVFLARRARPRAV